MSTKTVYGARFAAKLSLRECAEKIGINPIILARIEKGRKVPTDEEREAIVGLLGDVHFVTAEEARIAEVEFESEMKMLFAARTAIVMDANGSPAQGTVTCPKCAGTLRYSIASNGHVHAHCTTGGCLSWME